MRDTYFIYISKPDHQIPDACIASAAATLPDSKGISMPFLLLLNHRFTISLPAIMNGIFHPDCSFHIQLMQHSSNKTIVLEAYKYLIGQQRTDLIDTYVSDHYIQHNPGLKDGKAGLREALTYLKQLPQPAAQQSPVIRALAADDMVFLHLDLTFGNKKLVVAELYRTEQGKLTEHWDAIQEQPATTDTAVTMTNGSTVIEDLSLTASNKAIMTAFFQRLCHLPDPITIASHLSPTCIIHDPEIPAIAGRTALKMHRILAEGNFVVVQSEGKKAGTPSVFYDIYRLKNGVIAEYWCVSQAIPATMPHTNGMI